MTKRMTMLIGLALAMVPVAGSAQEVGASFRVLERAVQPDLVDSRGSGSGSPAALVPGGWAYSVSRGVGGGAGSPRLTSGVASEGRVEVAMPVATVAAAGDASDRTITWTFVPI